MRLFLLILIVLLIASCSKISNNRCKINGDENYLCASSLIERVCTSGDIVLSITADQEYKIPCVNDIINNDLLKTGKNLDICPPKVEY